MAREWNMSPETLARYVRLRHEYEADPNLTIAIQAEREGVSKGTLSSAYARLRHYVRTQSQHGVVRGRMAAAREPKFRVQLQPPAQARPATSSNGPTPGQLLAAIDTQLKKYESLQRDLLEVLRSHGIQP